MCDYNVIIYYFQNIIKDLLLEAIITFLLTIVVYIIFLIALGNYFKKKGLVKKNGNKKNRK